MKSNAYFVVSVLVSIPSGSSDLRCAVLDRFDLDLDRDRLADHGQIASGSPSVGASGAPKSLEEVERDHILSELRSTGGNREEAASLLGLGAATRP